MDIVAATDSYESWLGGLIPLYRPDIKYKHEQMADSFPFFRATYYRWMQLWDEKAGDLAEAPTVLAVGDLHVENYGTWRDADGRLCWGINDFDEVDQLPYTIDLVRLATSVRFAESLDINTDEACKAIVTGYHKALEAGGVPFVLEERHRKLRSLAMHADRDPMKFWKKLKGELDATVAEPPDKVKALLTGEFPAQLSPRFLFRPKAGMGSLGKPRYVALARWNDSWLAREAKALTPPATVWASGKSGGKSHAAEAAGRAVRCPDPSYRAACGWVVRRLAPRCSRIRLDHLRHASDLPRLLRAMGAEAANLHLGTKGAAEAVLADLAKRPKGWLAEAVRKFFRLVEQDRATWRKGNGR
jgi:hypothetical protein